MTRRFIYIALLASCLIAAGLTVHPAWAQNAPRPGMLVRAWLASQAERGGTIGRVKLHERAEWTIDGPFGVRSIGWEASVSGGPDTDGWQRDPISVRANGRPIPLTRWPDLDQQRRRMMGPHAEGVARAVIQFHRLIANMRPSGEAVHEALEGVPCWRVEMVPRRPREAVERYTLWFDQDTGHLVRSRALVRAPRTDRPFLITTEYTRADGFDVPSRRLMEGTTKTRRRRRTYTVLFKYEAAYSDYRFFRNEF